MGNGYWTNIASFTDAYLGQNNGVGMAVVHDELMQEERAHTLMTVFYEDTKLFLHK